MFKDFSEFVENVCRNWSGERTAALIVGLVFGAVAVLLAGKWLRFFVSPWVHREQEKERLRLEADNQRLREENKESRGKHQTLWQMREEWEADRAQLRERNRQMSEDCERLKEEGHRLFQELTRKKDIGRKLYQEYLKRGKHLEEREQQIGALTSQVQQIMAQEGKFWESPPTSPAPLFRPFDRKAASIIAVMNLKGGVGKTTLTANLGAALGQQDLRILLVDLDHQGTLTSLCLSEAQERDANAGEGQQVSNVIKAAGRFDTVAWQNLVALSHSAGSCLLPANKYLAGVEEDLKARWMLRKTERDSRFILREAFHAPLIQERFDLILLDCPPRLTTCCINALACADHVLIPVLLDKPSTDAVPNLLSWLRLLKDQGVCPQLALLGIVANGTHNQRRFTAREKTLWASLQQYSAEAWRERVYHFERSIPRKVHFADAAQQRSLAALDENLSPLFAELALELLSRKVIHEDRRTPVVPA